jgi:hypothetical protein
MRKSYSRSTFRQVSFSHPARSAGAAEILSHKISALNSAVWKITDRRIKFPELFQKSRSGNPNGRFAKIFSTARPARAVFGNRP